MLQTEEVDDEGAKPHAIIQHVSALVKLGRSTRSGTTHLALMGTPGSTPRNRAWRHGSIDSGCARRYTLLEHADQVSVSRAQAKMKTDSDLILAGCALLLTLVVLELAPSALGLPTAAAVHIPSNNPQKSTFWHVIRKISVNATL